MFRFSLTAGGLFLLLATPTLATDKETLKKQGFSERVVDSQTIWVNDTTHQTVWFRQDGSSERTIYAFRHSIDNDLNPIEEKYAAFVVAYAPGGEVTHVTDELGIPHSGDRLEATDEGVSFINAFDQKVTLRPDGGRRVHSQRGKGASYETWDTGLLRTRYNAEGVVTHRYGYGGRLSPAQAAQEPGRATRRLTEFITTNSKGKQEYWGLSEKDEATGRQTWLLKNGIGGKTVAMKDAHRIYVARDGGLVIEHPAGGKDSRGDELLESTTRLSLDGARIERRRTNLGGGRFSESTRVFGKAEDPLHSLEVQSRETGKGKTIVGATMVAGKLRYNSKDGLFWKQEAKEEEEKDEDAADADYFQGTFKILPDGSYLQAGFAVDANGKRLLEGRTPAPLREFVINTSGLSLERRRYSGSDEQPLIAWVWRDREGDLLKIVDARGRTCSFSYSDTRDENGKRLVRGVNDYQGHYWSSDDEGKTWRRPLAGILRDPTDTMTMSMDRETGSITWEGWERIAEEKLDGTLEINHKHSKRRQVSNYLGHVVLSVNKLEDQFEFQYGDDGTITSCVTEHPALQPGAGYNDDEYHVDWDGRVSFERRHTGAAPRVERLVLQPDGVLQVFDTQGRLLQVSHPAGHDSRYLYDEQGLASLTRNTRNGKQVVQRTSPGAATVTFYDRNGKQTGAAKGSLIVTPQGQVTIDHGVLSDQQADNLQFFLTDGTRRMYRQDLSGQWFDPFDRLELRSKGAESWGIGYRGDEDLPNEIADMQGLWQRQASDNDAELKQGAHEWIELRSGRKWTGGANTVDGGYQFREETGHTIDVSGDETEHWLASGGRYRINEADQVIEAKTSRLRRFAYEYDPSNQIRRVTEFTGSGDDVVVQEIYTVGVDCERVTPNKKTKLPILVLKDGRQMIWHVSGAKLAISPQGAITSLTPHFGDSIKVGQEYENTLVEKIEYDADRDKPRIRFKGGKSAVVDSAGSLITRFADGRLAWTTHPVEQSQPYRIDYRYDASKQLQEIVSRKTTGWADEGWRIRRQPNSKNQPWIKEGTGQSAAVAYESITVDNEQGGATLRRGNGHVIEKLNALGEVREYTLTDSGDLVMRGRNASNGLDRFRRIEGDECALFRSEEAEILHADSGFDSLTSFKKDTWEASFLRSEIPFRLRASQSGLVATQEGVTVTQHPDGSVSVACVDGSRTVLLQDHIVSQHFPAEGADVQEVVVHANGTREVKFVGGARHIQRANELLVRRVSATGKQLDSFRGAIAVSPYGTVTEVDLDHEFATVFPRDGGAAVFLSREVADDGKRVDYFFGKGRRELSEYRAIEPGELSRPVGFEMSDFSQPLATLICQIISRDARSPRLSPERKKPPASTGPSDDDFNKADRDGDGKLTIRELTGRQRAWLRGDKNRDRALSLEEWRAVAGGPAQARQNDLQQRWLRGQLIAFDKNRDGKLTRAEAPPLIKSLFDRFDADGDGLLDKSELEKYHREK